MLSLVFSQALTILRGKVTITGILRRRFGGNFSSFTIFLVSLQMTSMESGKNNHQDF